MKTFLLFSLVFGKAIRQRRNNGAADHSGLANKILLTYPGGLAPSISGGWHQTWKEPYGTYDAEYELAGRMNNAPFYKRNIGGQIEVLMYKDFSWFLCLEIRDNDEYNCLYKLTTNEEPEIMTDTSFNDLFNNTDWLVQELGPYDKNSDLMISYINEISNEKKTEIVITLYTNLRFQDGLFSFLSRATGDDITIVHQDNFGQFISSQIILPEGEDYKGEAKFLAGPNDRFIIKNGGNDGVYIEDIGIAKSNKFIINGIEYHSTYSAYIGRQYGWLEFWIDGNQQNCEKDVKHSWITPNPNLQTVPYLIIQNNQIIWTPCDVHRG